MNVFDTLIKQSKDPEGFIGKAMIHIMNIAHKERTRWALNKLEIGKDSIVLDVGCGGGNTIKIISKVATEGKVCGIDYSKESVETTRKKNNKAVEKGLVEVVRASVSNIPYSEETFHVVTAVQTHFYWPDLKNDIKEVYRIVKKNGIFMISSELYKIKYHMKHYKTNEEHKGLFKEAGFDNIRIFEDKGWLCIVGTKPM
ncbi:class I SAM-dependent methyltransferase [Vallitalea okinawensis]|uniref:class I SAM-dependent methyltransferase n=1 Tax=Vallitalea okinawensis TaxID=2078660 RepID=UPI000CFD8844|nr:class I SAM-dependent methyltransferase [Vallitalea okinawensis]